MKRFASRTLLLGLIVAQLLVFAPQPVMAQDPGLRGGLLHLWEETREEAGIRRFSGPAEVILVVINVVLALVAILATGVLIWAGISYVISLGNEEKIQTAKRMLLYSIIGLLIIGLAAVIVNVVLNLFIEGGGGEEGEEALRAVVNLLA